MFGREEIELLGTFLDKDFNHSPGQSSIGQTMIGRPDSFLDGAVVAFCFGYVILWVGKVHLNPELFLQWCKQGSEFVIRMNAIDSKAAQVVALDNGDQCLLVVVNSFAWDELSSSVV